jgi:lysozyme
MQISKKGINLLKQFEGIRLKAYVDPGTGGEPITIGYGSTRKLDGSKFKLGDTVTLEVAEQLLVDHINKMVIPTIASKVKVVINQNQIDALCSFIYNVGAGSFSNSTLLKRINNLDTKENIKEAFQMWTKSAGKTLEGLVERRKKESALYNS